MISSTCLTSLLIAATGLTQAADFEAQRARILANMQLVMGELPAAAGKLPLDVQIIEETRTAKYVRKKITYQAEQGDRVPAYLLIPLGRKPGQRLPAMLCLHQTTAIGKGEPAGLGGKVNLRYAHELAERGYVTLAPDYPSFGDYKYDFAKSLHASGSIKAIWNNIRAVDLLQSLPEVAGDQIGCIGHSLGGHNSLFTAAFEPRIQAVVSCCGFTSFAKYYDGNLKGWTSPRYMPRIASAYDSKPERLPFDFTDVLTAIAPRALFVVAPLHDDNFNVYGVRDVAKAIEPDFRKSGAKVLPTFRYPDCSHDFPPASRAEVYAWLDKVLGLPDSAAVQRWQITVAETAGIRRFGYPVDARVPLPQSLPATAGFRLLDGATPVVAQFERITSPDSRTAFVDVDFNVQNAPGESRTFVLEAGEGVKGPPIKGGLRLEELGDRFIVHHAAGLRFGVMKNLAGFLAEGRTPRLDYVAPGSPGLWFQIKDGTKHFLAGTKTGAPIARAGALATRFFFTGQITADDPAAGRWEVEMCFPSSKSWVECTLKIDKGRTAATALGLDLDLVQHKPPVLVDLGAGTLVYSALKPGQEIRVRAGYMPRIKSAPSWQVDLKNSSIWEPFVIPGNSGGGRNAEGWAHIMDNVACTAIAIANFEEGEASELRIDSQAKLRLQRRVPNPKKKLHFWLHFVDMPVHVGALTSPQAMLAPLQVRVEKEKP